MLYQDLNLFPRVCFIQIEKKNRKSLKVGRYYADSITGGSISRSELKHPANWVFLINPHNEILNRRYAVSHCHRPLSAKIGKLIIKPPMVYFWLLRRHFLYWRHLKTSGFNWSLSYSKLWFSRYLSWLILIGVILNLRFRLDLYVIYRILSLNN